MASRDNIRRLSVNAMLLCLSLLLSYLEAILPLTAWLPLPGFKLGLSNVLIMWCFLAVSPVDAAAVSFCRIIIVNLLFGNAASLAFSLCGGLLSYLGLWIFARLFRRVFGMIGVSVGCAALHNLGQLLAASVLYGTEVLLGYLPMLLIAALIFGTVTGVLLQLINSRLQKRGAP